MRKIAVAISKSGTGKTTTAVNLAHGIYEYARRDRGALAYANLTKRVVEDE